MYICTVEGMHMARSKGGFNATYHFKGDGTEKSPAEVGFSFAIHSQQPTIEWLNEQLKSKGVKIEATEHGNFTMSGEQHTMKPDRLQAIWFELASNNNWRIKHQG
jgi:hypothetical protein